MPKLQNIKKVLVIGSARSLSVKLLSLTMPVLSLPFSERRRLESYLSTVTRLRL